MGLFKKSTPDKFFDPAAQQKADEARAHNRAESRRRTERCIRDYGREIREANNAGLPDLAADLRAQRAQMKKNLDRQ